MPSWTSMRHRRHHGAVHRHGHHERSRRRTVGRPRGLRLRLRVARPVDPFDQTLHFASESVSVSDEFAAATATATFARGIGLSGRAWSTRDLVFTANLGEVEDCVRAPVAQRVGVRSGICFPLFADGRGQWRSIDQVEVATAEWVNWFNHRRLYQYCGDIPPVQMEVADYARQPTPTTAGATDSWVSGHARGGSRRRLCPTDEAARTWETRASKAESSDPVSSW